MSKLIWCVVGVGMMWLGSPALAQQGELPPASYGPPHYEAPGDYLPVGPCARCGWPRGSCWEGYCHECSRCWTLVDSLHALKESLFGWLHPGCGTGCGYCAEVPCSPCRHGFLPRLWRPVFPGPCCDHPPVSPPAEVYEGSPMPPSPDSGAEKTSQAPPRKSRTLGTAVFRRPVPRRAFRSPSYRSNRPVPRRAY